MGFKEACIYCTSQICCARYHNRALDKVSGKRSRTVEHDGDWVTYVTEKGQEELPVTYDGVSTFRTSTKSTTVTKVSTMKKPSCGF
jgi:hypothetical protein